MKSHVCQHNAEAKMSRHHSEADVDNYPVVVHFTPYQSRAEGARWINATSGETNLEAANSAVQQIEYPWNS